MEEIWKNINGFDGDYQVSNLGQVRSVKLGRVLKATPDVRGLCRVSLRKADKVVRKYIHQLVLETFKGKKDGCKIIAHRDGNTGISIAKKYGISASVVSSIKRDKAWKIV